MKITKVTTFALYQKLGDADVFSYSQAWYNSRSLLVLKLETDDGFVGWGEAFGPPLVNKAIIDEVYRPMVIDRDPFDSGVIWEELYNRLRDHGQKGVTIEALSAIDIALWDIKGQALGLPVYKLLGGSPRSRVMPYATGLYRRKTSDPLKALVAEATSYVEQGYKAIKLKVGFGIADDVIAVRAIRKAIGDPILLMVDANHGYNASTAIKLAQQIEEYDIHWLEEPVPPEDLDGYCQVKSKTTIPIAGGEAEFTRYGFNVLLQRRAVDIVQPDCCACGGISEFQKIATLATIYNIQCYPHIWGSSIAVMTGLHCAFALPHYPPSLFPAEMLLEMDRTPNIFREKLSTSMPILKDGYMELPTKSGLGLEIDETLIKVYTISS